MKILFFLFLIFSLIAVRCQNQIQEKPNELVVQTEDAGFDKVNTDTINGRETGNTARLPQATGAYFFDFDEIEYYSMPSDNDNFIKLLNRELSPKYKDLQQKIVFEDAPSRLSDTYSIRKFEKVGYDKRLISSENRILIREAFRENMEFEPFMAKCAPVYRDIFVFKKKQKLIGLAKVCFECAHTLIIGSKADHSKFGGYDELYQLKKFETLLSDKQKLSE